MIAVLTILGWSFVGSVFWVVSTEVLAMYYGSQGWNPVLVGTLCSTGQNGMYVLVFFFGDAMMARWTWLSHQVGRVRAKLGYGARRGFLITTSVGHVFGVPPAPAMVALAPGFGVNLWTLLPITWVSRAVRFTVLAAFGEILVAWWESL